jgi:hypothetical protein
MLHLKFVMMMVIAILSRNFLKFTRLLLHLSDRTFVLSEEYFKDILNSEVFVL